MTPCIVLGITGASGAVYGARLLEVLVRAGCEVHMTISPAGADVLKTELNEDVDLDAPDIGGLIGCRKLVDWFGDRPKLGEASSDGHVHAHHWRDFYAPIASGSFLTSGMVICPCSGGTASAVAHGTSSNLIHRAADVHLKEGRKLILVPRETPLSAIQLENMARCARAGAVVLPAMPGFYHGVSAVGDLVDFVVARICDQLGVEHRLMRRWGTAAEEGEP